jgi:hypothetical protein
MSTDRSTNSGFDSRKRPATVEASGPQIPSNQGPLLSASALFDSPPALSYVIKARSQIQLPIAHHLAEFEGCLEIDLVRLSYELDFFILGAQCGLSIN